MSRPVTSVILLGCVKGKGSTPAPAADLYDSQLWRARRGYATRAGAGEPWAIVSARYGLVMPDRVIEPYDVTVADLARDGTVDCWALEIAGELGDRWPDLADVELHAGANYRVPLQRALAVVLPGVLVSCPLIGLGIGEQLAWYARCKR